jgi:hypothetical protein
MVVIMSIAAANYDPDVFERPFEFDVHRAPKHLSFSVGPHNCAGALLTRRIMATSLDRLLRRFPDFRLVDPDFKPTYGGAQLGQLEIMSLPMQLRWHVDTPPLDPGAGERQGSLRPGGARAVAGVLARRAALTAAPTRCASATPRGCGTWPPPRAPPALSQAHRASEQNAGRVLRVGAAVSAER